jgi:hypothetical protein
MTLLAQASRRLGWAYDYSGWAVLEWECCLKDPEDGAREAARFIADHIIRTTDKAFDDFADSAVAASTLPALMGIESS